MILRTNIFHSTNVRWQNHVLTFDIHLNHIATQSVLDQRNIMVEVPKFYFNHFNLTFPHLARNRDVKYNCKHITSVRLFFE